MALLDTDSIPGSRRAMVTAMATAPLLALAAWPRIFARLEDYDDEGCALAWIQQLVDGEALYDRAIHRYGPFYYELWRFVFETLGIAPTLDSGRIVTLALWVLSATMIGATVGASTGSVPASLAAVALSWSVLGSLASEPMSPGGLSCLLVAVLPGLLALAPRRPGWPRTLSRVALGVVLAALALIKVNIGIFSASSVALVLCIQACGAPASESRDTRRRLRRLVEGVFVAAPFLLVGRALVEPWALAYATCVGLSGLAVVVATRSNDRDTESSGWFDRNEILAPVGGAMLTTLGVCAIAMAGGTQAAALVDGVLLAPLRLIGIFRVPLPLDPVAVALAVGNAVAAFVQRTRRLQIAMALVGGSVIFWQLTQWTSHSAMLRSLPFAWLVLVPGRSLQAVSGRERRLRLALATLAPLQALQGFPVAGSQIPWGSLLLAPIGALILTDGVAGVMGTLERRGVVGSNRAVRALRLAPLVIAALLVAPSSRAGGVWWHAYRDGVPLQIPGATLVRLPPAQAATVKWLVQTIREHCSALITVPGTPRWNILAAVPPPHPAFTFPSWVVVVPAEQQRAAARELTRREGACVVRNTEMLRFWCGNGCPDANPLVDELERPRVDLATGTDRTAGSTGRLELLGERDGWEILRVR